MYEVYRYHKFSSHALSVTQQCSVKLFKDIDIYREGESIDITNLTERKHLSIDKIIKSSLLIKTEKYREATNILVYNYPIERTLIKVGTDKSNRPVLKFKDIWLRMPESLFNALNLNYLHSLGKSLNDLIKINIDDYNPIVRRTRFGYLDITLSIKEDK